MRSPSSEEELIKWFWARVQKTEGCWVWTGVKNWKGYGDIRTKFRKVRAHRFAWEIARGPIPAGLYIDHMCYRKDCVNPSHLRLATDGQNKQNRPGAQANSTTGVRGVSLCKKTGRYQARAKINGKKYHLGSYKTLAEADSAARAWRTRHMPYSIQDKAPAGAFFNDQKSKEIAK